MSIIDKHISASIHASNRADWASRHPIAVQIEGTESLRIAVARAALAVREIVEERRRYPDHASYLGRHAMRLIPAIVETAREDPAHWDFAAAWHAWNRLTHEAQDSLMAFLDAIGYPIDWDFEDEEPFTPFMRFQQFLGLCVTGSPVVFPVPPLSEDEARRMMDVLGIKPIAGGSPEAQAVVADEREFNARHLSDSIKRVMHASDRKQESQRFRMDSVSFSFSGDWAEIVSTDGRRLARQRLADLSGSGAEREPCQKLMLLASVKAILASLKGARKEERATLEPVQDGIVVRFRDSEALHPHCQDRFPRYQDIIPDGYENGCSFDIEAFRESVNGAMDFLDDDCRAINLFVCPQSIIVDVTKENQTPYRVSIPCQTSGKPRWVSMIGKQLSDLVKALPKSGRLLLSIESHRQAVRFDALDGFTLVAMPATKDDDMPENPPSEFSEASPVEASRSDKPKRTPAERIAKMTGRATLYELAITRGSESYLVAYCNRRGRRTILECLADEHRVDQVKALTGDDGILWAKKSADGGMMGEWNVRFTGRTQRDAIQAGELPYVSQLPTETTVSPAVVEVAPEVTSEPPADFPDPLVTHPCDTNRVVTQDSPEVSENAKPGCRRCRFPAQTQVRTRHFGLEDVCIPCSMVLLADRQCQGIEQPPQPPPDDDDDFVEVPDDDEARPTWLDQPMPFVLDPMPEPELSTLVILVHGLPMPVIQFDTASVEATDPTPDPEPPTGRPMLFPAVAYSADAIRYRRHQTRNLYGHANTPRVDFRDTPRTPTMPVARSAFLTIQIQGKPYGVTLQGNVVTLETSKGDTYDIDREHASCSCNDYRYRRDGLDSSGCKHVRGCREVGLIPVPNFMEVQS